MCILIVLTHLKSLVPIYKRHAFYLDIFKYLFRGQNRPECIVRLNHTWGFIMSHQLWMSNFCWMKFSCLIVVYWLVLSILLLLYHDFILLHPLTTTNFLCFPDRSSAWCQSSARTAGGWWAMIWKTTGL